MYEQPKLRNFFHGFTWKEKKDQLARYFYFVFSKMFEWCTYLKQVNDRKATSRIASETETPT